MSTNRPQNVAVALALLLISNVAGAATYTLSEARERFPAVFDKAIAGKLNSVRDEARALHQYPLHPYLEAADIEHLMQTRPGDALDERIEAFLQAHPEIATFDRMRSAWLVSMHVRGKYREFLDHYTESDSLTMRCRHISARIKLNRMEQLEADARSMWLQGESLPKSCDPVFDWLKDRNKLTDELIRARAVLAMKAGNTGLADWLSKKLSPTEQALFQRWIQVHRDPVVQISRLSKLRDAKITGEVIVHGIKQAAHRNTDKTAELTPGLISMYKLTPVEAGEAQRYLGYRYALSRKPESVTWFARGGSAGGMDEVIRAWRIRAALFHGDWKKARLWTTGLPREMSEHREWQYWRARALEATGDLQEARRIYTEVARDKGYYHYLAADRLNIPYAIKHVPTPENVITREKVESLAGVLRTREWLALNDERRARREWHSLIRLHPDKEMLRHLSALANRWGWHFEAITTQARSDYWDDLHLRYPLPFRDIVMRNARALNMDPAWIYGIMRSESLFVTDANSPAGALGLMQLLPSTARIVGRQIGLKVSGTRSILKPENNIRLGANYLKGLLDDHNGHYAMASAAYNAGPHRVKRWRPEHAPIDADIWVTNIPFNETRGYVDRVLTHTTAFQWRLGEIITPMSQRMSRVKPTRYPDKP